MQKIQLSKSTSPVQSQASMKKLMDRFAAVLSNPNVDEGQKTRARRGARLVRSVAAARAKKSGSTT